MSRQQPSFYPPSKEFINDAQIGPTLAIIRELQPYIIDYKPEPGSVPKDTSLDGGVESAATTTFIKACSRLDAILDDSARWSLRDRNTLVAELIRTQKAQQRFIDAQRQSSENLQSPHFLLRPTLAIAGQEYLAYWGNINEAGQAIVGRGATPEDALLDFDAAFQRTPEEQLYLVAEQAGVKLDKPPTS